MPTYRYPILIWEDFTGHFTARLVEDPEAPAGFGATKSDALFQLKDYLNWTILNRPWVAEPDFHNAALVNLRVEVRPEYQVKDRVYPCDESIVLRVPCVQGSNAGGLLVCSLPTMGLKFFYQESGRLKHLVNHYSQERLRGQPPHAISRFLQPRSVELDEIVIHSNRKRSGYQYTPELGTLISVAEPLGDKKLRRQFSRAWERDLEVADLVKRIGREKANVIISGEGGSGKTSVLIEAVRMVEGQAEQEQNESDDVRHKYWMTSGSRLIAGMQYLGEWQERCERVIEELSGIDGVLCVDNLLELIRAGTGSVSESIAMFFIPYLQRGELRMVAEATPAELDACRRLLPGLADLFQILPLHPFSREQAVRALNRVATTHSRNRKIEIGPDLAGMTHRLFRRFQPYQAFPGKSVAFINQLFERSMRHKLSRIANNDVIAHFVEQTGLPEIFLRDAVPLAHSEVLEAFRNQVIGQDAACEAAARLVTTFKAGLNDPNRPLGVLLFCGPTGVGKTELARAIARYFFGAGKQPEESRLVRLDMSEYSGWNGAQRLLAGSDGEPSDLIKRVRQQPFCVVLFDEIEKADADVFDVLLSVFDEGRLTDRYGRVTTFRSAVIIMTSNLGTDKLGATGFENRGAPSYTREAMGFFRPEFFNRIDAIVQFNALSKEMMRRITAKELSEISGREGFLRNDLRLEWDDEVIEHLISAGFDQRYGARPLQRTIERLVVAPLARYLLAHPEAKGAGLFLSLDREKKTLTCNQSSGSLRK
jgi:ATP-dependent Clp protease ATP-binding subunit ClpC